MRTQLIPLESHDDLISIRDRMSWAKTPRILLIWPTSEHITLRPLDLKVLQRHAVALGAQLGLVTRGGAIKREAQTLGIPVFNSTGDAQRSPWPERTALRQREHRPPRKDLRDMQQHTRLKTASWQKLPIMRLVIFTLGVFGVLAVVSLFIPHAQIILTPESDSQMVTLPVQANPSVDQVYISGSIPAREKSVIVEGNRDAPATGLITVADTKATGKVTFRNLTDEAVHIPAGTILTSTGLPGVRFITLKDVDLEGELKASANVPVQAEVPGSDGNVQAGSIRAIEGSIGLFAAATNEEPTKGGREHLVKAATEEDRSYLRESLLADLEEQALEAVKSELATDDMIIADSLQLAQVLDESYDPPSGQAGLRISLRLRVEFTASYASGEDLAELARVVMDASLPADFTPDNTSLSFEAVNNPTVVNDGGFHWLVRASRRLDKKIAFRQVFPLVQGRDVEHAQARLNDTLPLEAEPKIMITPSWWPWMPLIPFNISIEQQ